MSANDINSQEKVEMISAYADDIKAEQIDVLDIRAKTSVADYFVVCTGTSDVHVNSIAGRIEEKMREKGVKPTRQESTGSGWVLLDYGDVVVHVMREERRQFYDLETLWATKESDPNLID